jgi:hypothetical protein
MVDALIAEARNWNQDLPTQAQELRTQEPSDKTWGASDVQPANTLVETPIG